MLNFNSRPHAKRSRDAVFPQGSDRAALHLVIFFLTLSFGVSGAAQNQTPKAAEKPAGQVFPSAVPAPDQPEAAPAADDTGPSPKLGVGDLLEVSVYNVPELTTKSRLGTNGDVYLPLIDYVHWRASPSKKPRP